MKQLAKLFSGLVIGSIAGIAATIIFSPKKRTEWFDEIQDRTQDVLSEFNKAAEAYKTEMQNDLAERRQN